MTKRVFIIHGWDYEPKDGWYPWLKQELEKKGFKVITPLMPNPEEPKREEWVPYLRQVVGQADKDTYFVGHSVGGQTILRYLETLEQGEKVGGAVFVAGWLTLMNLETEEEKNIAQPWLETPINWEKAKERSNKFTAIFSDNDPFVPLSDSKIFKDKLGALIVVEHDQGHFSGSDGVTKLPSALQALLDISK